MSLFEDQSKEFQCRHIGPDENKQRNAENHRRQQSDELIDKTVPSSIRMQQELESTCCDE